MNGEVDGHEERRSHELATPECLDPRTREPEALVHASEGIVVGIHHGQPEVDHGPTPAMTIRLDGPGLLDADGELHDLRHTEVRVRVQAGAIRVATP